MLLLVRRSSWFNLLRHAVKDKLMPPPKFQCPITVIKLSIWLPLKSVHHHLFSPQNGWSGEAFWSQDLGSFCMFGLVLLIIAVLLWIDHSARLVRCFISFMYNHMSASLPCVFFQDGVVKQLCLRHGKWSVLAFLQFTHCCSAPPIFITRRYRGVTDELIWGSGVLLIDSWSDPASVVQYSLHQQMTPPGKWMGPFFFGPFSNERERSALLPSSFFRTTFQRGLKALHFEV